MSLGRRLYDVATTVAQPFLGLLVRQREKAGKEVTGRTQERFAQTSEAPLPQPVVWMHGASIGETRILLALAPALKQHRPDLTFLFTSQTATSAELIEREIRAGTARFGEARHQFLPVDTRRNARRFLDHWSPALAVFSEGDIWPNLLREARQRHVPTALVNARMTARSVAGWARWRGFSRELFGGFDVILAADSATAEGLSGLAGRAVAPCGNLKSALPPPSAPEEEISRTRTGFVGGRRCLVGVSTHPGEEDILLDAAALIEPSPAVILVPRHPERGDEIAAQLQGRGLSFARRSAAESLSPAQDVLLADTLGEVGLFASLADTVYLGGGHAPGVGGHNPLEILKLGKPVVTGPEIFNFAEVIEPLKTERGLAITASSAEIAQGFPFPTPSPSLLARLETEAQRPMDTTVEALLPLLPPRKAN